MKKRILITVGAVLITTSVAGTAFAAGIMPSESTHKSGRLSVIHYQINKKISQPVGLVKSVSGANFVLELKARGKNASSTDYTVMTNSSTTFARAGQPATIADLATSQMVKVVGTVDKTAMTINATKVNILDKSINNKAVSGKVMAISGTNITITTKSGTSLIIDASTAKIMKGPGKKNKAATIALSDIAVGDQLMVKASDVTSSTARALSIWDISKK